MRTFKFNPEYDIPSLAGKVVLVTGGTAGLGAVSAVELAKHSPARIYITGRNARAAKAVIETVRRSCQTPPDIEFLPCDLADLSSVQAAAETVIARETRLDILMANAGIAATPLGWTKDGYEAQFSTNFLGHALLIRKLLPLLRTTAAEQGDARVVSLTSFAHNVASGIALDGVKARSSCDSWPCVGKWIRYGESKLASLLFARELARRYPDISSISVHPGVSGTALVEKMSLMDRLSTKALGVLEGGVLEPEQGALNQLWAATAAREEIQNGAMYEPVARRPKKLSRAAGDDELARKLWDWSEEELERWIHTREK